MSRIYLAALTVLFLFTGQLIADEAAPGHWLVTRIDNGNPAADCSVRCYRYDIDWQNSDYYKTGYTGEDGQSSYPPNYNVCRFIDTTYYWPTVGYHIDAGSKRAYIYYAIRIVGGQMRYSEWSSQMVYPNPWYRSVAYLYLARTSPPPWPPQVE